MTKQTGGEVFASASNSNGKGWRRRNRIVASSGAESSSVAAISPCPSPSRAAQRRIEATASRAVTLSPSWKTSPGRSATRTVRPPSSTAWPAAICGRGR